jgi:hypothetical protein
MTAYDDDFKGFSVVQGVNTLQHNDYLVNSDASTYSIQLRRITSQINKELQINAKRELLGQLNGVNRNTLSAAFIVDWTSAYLGSRTSTAQVDNLLISFKDVTATLDGSAYFVSYAIVANSEIDKIFFTGFLVE